jgi:plastocyanin
MFIISTSILLPSTAYAQGDSSIIIATGSSSPSNPQFYNPSNYTTSSGSSITWTNKDSTEHTVTFINPVSKTNVLGPDDDVVTSGSTIKYKFINPGSYDYYCRFFPFMTGQINVK